MEVIDVKALMKERGLRGFSKLRKGESITCLQNNLQPMPAPWHRPPRPMRSPHPLSTGISATTVG